MFYSHECTKFFSKKLLFGKFCHKKKQPRLSRFNPICHFKTEERAPVTQRERERERERVVQNGKEISRARASSNPNPGTHIKTRAITRPLCATLYRWPWLCSLLQPNLRHRISPLLYPPNQRRKRLLVQESPRRLLRLAIRSPTRCAWRRLHRSSMQKHRPGTTTISMSFSNLILLLLLFLVPMLLQSKCALSFSLIVFELVLLLVWLKFKFRGHIDQWILRPNSMW